MLFCPSKYAPIATQIKAINELSPVLKTQDETSKKQYDLLLKKEVLQAHLEFKTKTGISIFSIVCVPEKILESIGLKFKIKSKETISYTKILRENLM